MALDNLLTALAAARRVRLQAAGAVFELDMPSEHALRAAFERHRNPQGVVMESVALRELLDAHLRGWEGLRACDLLPEAGNEPLPYTPAHRAALLEHRQDIADELTLALAVERQRRRDGLEAARKNS